MDFFKLKKFRNVHKPNANDVTQDQPVPQPEEPKNGSGDALGKSVNVDSTNSETEDDDDDDDEDDFITNEVKRRLKEMRRNSFMVLIPEETSPADEEEEEEEEEEEGETSSSEWRDVEAEGRRFWSGFDAVYDIYYERMLFFDRSNSQQLLEVGGSHVVSTPSPRCASKKLIGSPLGCLSLRKFEEEIEQPAYQDLETAYVGQVCLSWEALQWQYTQLMISCQPPDERATSYNHSAQQFQQFQVLLQRFIENEPFEMGSRPEIYARARKSLPKLLQVPKIQGCEEKRSDFVVVGRELMGVIGSSILSFRQFIKMDKKKAAGGGGGGMLGSQNQMAATPDDVQQIQSSLEKKAMKLKELWKRRRRRSSYKKKSWATGEEEDDVEMLLGLVDVKVLSRVVRMLRITKQQLFWCEEKMKKLGLSADGSNLHRDPSPLLFPC